MSGTACISNDFQLSTFVFHPAVVIFIYTLETGWLLLSDNVMSNKKLLGLEEKDAKNMVEIQGKAGTET